MHIDFLNSKNDIGLLRRISSVQCLLCARGVFNTLHVLTNLSFRILLLLTSEETGIVTRVKISFLL